MYLKSLHSPVDIQGFCDVINETKIKYFRTFPTFYVASNLYKSTEQQIRGLYTYAHPPEIGDGTLYIQTHVK